MIFRFCLLIFLGAYSFFSFSSFSLLFLFFFFSHFLAELILQKSKIARKKINYRIFRLHGGEWRPGFFCQTCRRDGKGPSFG
jgi:hypothetical protein